MNILAAADLNWNIGYKGDLQVRIPDDLKRFKAITLGKVVVMGRKTLESLPGQKPLPMRTNIVLTRQSQFHCEGPVICHSIEELFEYLRDFNPDDIYLIGGGELFGALLPYCRLAYITRINKAFPADAGMPDLDADDSWELVGSEGPCYFKDGIYYSYMLYKNVHPLDY